MTSSYRSDLSPISVHKLSKVVRRTNRMGAAADIEDHGNRAAIRGDARLRPIRHARLDVLARATQRCEDAPVLSCCVIPAIAAG